jgi:hypothetical protein
MVAVDLLSEGFALLFWDFIHDTADHVVSLVYNHHRVVEHVLGFVVRQFFYFFFGYTVVVYACVFLFNHYIYLVVDLALLGLGQVVEVRVFARR